MSSARLEKLSLCLKNALTEKLVSANERLDELTITVNAEDSIWVMQTLRDHPDLNFEMLIDLCGVDYFTYGAESVSDSERSGKRFAVVYHLLSISHNCTIRTKIRQKFYIGLL